MAEILEKVGPTNFFLHSGSEKVGGANFFHHFLELQRPSNIFNDTRRGKTCQAKAHIYPGPVLLANSALHQKVKKVEQYLTPVRAADGTINRELNCVNTRLEGL